MKKGFILRKGKVYLLLREEREEVHKFILEQLMLRSLTVDLNFISLSSFHFIFLFLEQLGFGVYQSCCHISHKLMAKSQD